MIKNIDILNLIITNDDSFFDIKKADTFLKNYIFHDKKTSLFNFIMYHGNLKQIQYTINVCNQNDLIVDFNNYLNFHSKNNMNHFIFFFELFNNNNSIAKNPLCLIDTIINNAIKKNNHNQFEYILKNLKCRSTFYFTLYMKPFFKSQKHFDFMMNHFESIISLFDPKELLNNILNNHKKHLNYPQFLSKMIKTKKVTIEELNLTHKEMQYLLPKLL